MKTRREKFNFPSHTGDTLAGLLELPEGDAKHTALFAHCFTCSKDIAAAGRISRALAGLGFAVLRFDFTGLGGSEGDFANTHFSSNVDDLVAAADALAQNHPAPSLLIGHSLGGAAVLACAHRIASARAVVTIGAPSSPDHVAHHFKDAMPEIQAKGQAEVMLAGRPFTIKDTFIQDIESQKLEGHIARLGKALLIFHAPSDDTVGIDEAARIYRFAKHPKSFVSLDGADHLLTKRVDSQYVANMIAAWVDRYLA